MKIHVCSASFKSSKSGTGNYSSFSKRVSIFYKCRDPRLKIGQKTVMHRSSIDNKSCILPYRHQNGNLEWFFPVGSRALEFECVRPWPYIQPSQRQLRCTRGWIHTASYSQEKQHFEIFFHEYLLVLFIVVVVPPTNSWTSLSFDHFIVHASACDTLLRGESPL